MREHNPGSSFKAELLRGAAQPVAPGDPSVTETTTISDGRQWYELINEGEAADYLGLTVRTMQAFRYDGRGPPFIRISSRCIRYRRFDLNTWAESRMRSSTSDEGAETA